MLQMMRVLLANTQKGQGLRTSQQMNSYRYAVVS